jgi:monooxygenase
MRAPGEHEPAAGDDARDVDVLIVGAGLSGVATAYYLQTRCPGRSYAIVEARHAIGGTWDLFRYPGVRSDSDMFTLGYSFRPCDSDRMMWEGPAIREYVADTAREHGIDRRIHFGRRVSEARWDTDEARWTVTVAGDDGRETSWRCRFVAFCSGYYRYDAGFEPQWPGRERFAGRIVHPQHWPDDLDCTGKRVVIIGSGATAVTLLPALARQAAHVTMLQRSPSYVLALPARDAIAAALRRWLPRRVAHGLTRWKNIVVTAWVYRTSRRQPERLRGFLMKSAQRLLGPQFDVSKHFNPRYDPWDQRLCITPDGDFFAAIRSGRAGVVTDSIERFTERGILLASGEELPADIVVSATGLRIQVAGGARLVVDGRELRLADTVTYKGLMYSGVPNLISIFGYTNASWTLKCELIARFLCRVLDRMAARGSDICVPVNDDAAMPTTPTLDALTSGYVQRAAAILPRQGDRAPWRMHQNYFEDLRALRFSSLADPALRFGRRGERIATAVEPGAAKA